MVYRCLRVCVYVNSLGVVGVRVCLCEGMGSQGKWADRSALKGWYVCGQTVYTCV